MISVLVDANVILRLLINNGSDDCKKATEWVKNIENGKVQGIILESVLSEISYAMEKYYFVTRNDYVPKLAQLLLIPHIKVRGMNRSKIKKLLDIWQKSNLDLVDLMLMFWANEEKQRIMSFDKHLKKYWYIGS